MNLDPLLEVKYFQWRKERCNGLAVETMAGGMILILKRSGRNGLTISEIIIAPKRSRSVLEKLYNRLSHEADSPIGSAKRIPFTALAFKSDILFLLKLCSRGARWRTYMAKSTQRQQGPVPQSDPPREVRLASTSRAVLAFKSDIEPSVTTARFRS